MRATTVRNQRIECFEVAGAIAWEGDDLVAALQTLVDAKDTPGSVKGGPYEGYALVIFTVGVLLNRDNVSTFLDVAPAAGSIIPTYNRRSRKGLV